MQIDPPAATKNFTTASSVWLFGSHSVHETC